MNKNQDIKASLKCRHCDKRYLDMASPLIGFCPNCHWMHEIVLREPKKVQE